MDLDTPYQLSDRVGLRDESFGAMAYHYDTRRLVFLKSTQLTELVRSLAQHPSPRDAIAAAAPDRPSRRDALGRALKQLAEAEIVEPRT